MAKQLTKPSIMQENIENEGKVRKIKLRQLWLLQFNARTQPSPISDVCTFPKQLFIRPKAHFMQTFSAFGR